MSILDRITGKDDGEDKKLIDKVQENVAPVAQTVMRGAGALMGSTEGGSPQELVMDPREGEFNANIAGKSLIRSLATTPEAKEMLSSVLQSKYGNMVLSLGENPDAKRLLTKAPILKEAVNVILDENTQQRFHQAKRRSIGTISNAMGQIANTHNQNVTADMGYALAAKALRENRQLNPTAKLDEQDILSDAEREAVLRTGAGLNEAQQQAVLKAASEALDRGFSKKAVPMVYHRKKGGLLGQRYKAAEDELRVRGGAMQSRVQAGVAALESVRGKLQQAMDTKAPDRRSEGARVNIPEFRKRYAASSDKLEALKNISFVDKIAKAEEDVTNVIETLSDDAFKNRVPGRTKILLLRDLDEDGGAQKVIQNLMYKDDEKDGIDSSPSLLNILRKIKKELYFKEDVLYTTHET